MSLSKSGDKLLEITRDPYFEDIKWEYCIFGAVHMGDEERGENFEGLGMGAITFFQSLKYGARTFLACEIGGLVVFFHRKIPQNPAWVPGKFEERNREGHKKCCEKGLLSPSNLQRSFKEYVV